jgi:hypothetical protein
MSFAFQFSKENSSVFSLSKALDTMLGEDVDQQVSSVKSAVKAASAKTRKGSGTGGSRSTAKKPSRAAAAKQLLETPSAEGRAPLSLITPAHAQNHRLDMMMGGATPFITPKFNTRTPLSRTVSRAARPNEILVSLSGSPVNPLNLRTKVGQQTVLWIRITLMRIRIQLIILKVLE